MNHITSSSLSQHDETQEYEAVSRRLNRKMDIFLLPFLSILYLFNGLDRSNIGNAETQGKLADRDVDHPGMLITDQNSTPSSKHVFSRHPHCQNEHP
jgi:hypothetical protein